MNGETALHAAPAHTAHLLEQMEGAVAQTASFALPIWKRLLDNTTVTIGCNDVFGQDPPGAASSANYADFLYDSTGRFVYVSLTKKF